MRNLSDTLLQTQRSRARLPYVKVEIIDRIAGIPRLAYSRLYNGNEPDFYHAVTMPGDGSLIRARVDSSNNRLYLQRVATPAPGSDFSSWTDICSVSSVSGIALCSRGATVLLFYVGPNQETIYLRESTDYGTTFASPVAVETATASVGWLVADISDAGVVALLYSVANTVYVKKRVDGVWQAPAAWTNSVATITGLACLYQGDWNVVVSGQDSSDNYKLWTCVYGDGYSVNPGVWSELAELTVANAGSNIEFRCPFIGFPDVFRVFFVEKYTGTASYSRPFWCYSPATAEFIANLWREPVPFDLTLNYGLAIAHHGSYVWLSMPSGVWRAAISPPTVDVTPDVVGLSGWTEPTLGRIQIELRNDDGRYGEIGSGNYAAIKHGAEVLVSPGYRTTAGDEVSAGPAYWIESWEYISEGARANFVLYAHDGWGLLHRWKARRQFSWEAGAKNIFQLLSFIFARAGLEFSAFSTSSTMTDQYLAFTMHPGQSGASVVARLLDMVPDVLFFRGHYGYIKNPLLDDQSVYSYGSEHAIAEGRYISVSPRANRVQVYGDEVLGESFDWIEVSQVYDRLQQVHDLNLDTVAKAEARADAELRHETIAGTGGQIVVPVNCGQELYDVIDITDERAGLTADKRRVLGLALRYSTRGKNAHYEQQIRLGGV